MGGSPDFYHCERVARKARRDRAEAYLLGALLGALIIQMISTGIVILGIDQNYSRIIIGAVIVIAVVLDQLNNYLAKRRLARRAANP